MSETRKRRSRLRAAPPPEPQNQPAVDDPRSDEPVKPKCTATNRHGEPCELYPIKGGTVCHKHGGSAPQVRKAAALRLLELADPAISALSEVVKDGKRDSDRVKAATAILDRAGLGPSSRVELETPGWHGVVATAIVSDGDDEVPEWRRGRYADPEEDPEG